MTVPNWFRHILAHLEIPFEECPFPPALSAGALERGTPGPPTATEHGRGVAAEQLRGHIVANFLFTIASAKRNGPADRG